MGGHLDRMNAHGTYVYCLVAAARRPSLRGSPKGLAGTGLVRLLALPPDAETSSRRVRLQQWLIVADAPLNMYGEAAINQKLSDLDWISRAAIAHEAVVESFIGASALLPMKLFTIFTSDERAVDHIRRQQSRIDATLKRVMNQSEWGVRVIIDRVKAAKAATAEKRRSGSRRPSGADYLMNKKAQRDAATELARRARGVVGDLYDELSAHAGDATRRTAAELPVQGGSLLIDAAFLVPRTKTARFQAAVARRARALAPQGYTLSLTGPWPPYSFMRE
jgi:gas vesicle protein GvpL/GvpF